MNRIIITGGPGFGKTSLIQVLAEKGYTVFHEVSREIMDHQKATNGQQLPWLDHDGFHSLVFKGRLTQWEEAKTYTGNVFFDRGLPDSIAYLLKDGLIPDEKDIETVKTHPYFPLVFITPPWEEIYQLDKQRWEDYAHATQVHEALVSYYTSLGYEIVLLPKISIKERIELILSRLSGK